MNSGDQKIILCGAFGSGRTSFITKFKKEESAKSIKLSNAKCDIHSIEFFTSAGSKTFKVYDTALHAKGGLPSVDFFRNSDACILFYDTTDEQSYIKMAALYDEFIKVVGKHIAVPTIFIGTKVDVSKRGVDISKMDFATKGRDKAIPYIEISSKANYNLQEAFELLIKEMFGEATQITDPIELVSDATATVDDSKKAELAQKVAEIKAAFATEEETN